MISFNLFRAFSALLCYGPFIFFFDVFIPALASCRPDPVYLDGDVPARGASPGRGHKRGLAFERRAGASLCPFHCVCLCLLDLIKTIEVH